MFTKKAYLHNSGGARYQFAAGRPWSGVFASADRTRAMDFPPSAPSGRLLDPPDARWGPENPPAVSPIGGPPTADTGDPRFWDRDFFSATALPPAGCRTSLYGADPFPCPGGL